MKKLIMSLFAVFALVVSLTTSTYAFIVISNDASIKEYNFNVEAQHGLEISLDGKIYYNDIKAEDIKKKISAGYDKLQFTGVTLKQDSDQIVYENGNVQFVKDLVTDGKHSYQDAVANQDYIVFDLWLKMLNTNEADTNSYSLKMTNNTNITSTPTTIKLDNKLNTMDADKSYGPKLNEEDTSIEEITVNMQDAMRMAVSIVDDNPADNLEIYEQHIGLGSHAVEGSTDPLHDKTKNAMYTYYNNIKWKTPFEAAGDDYTTNDDVTSQVLATFSNTTTQVVHLRYYIWLEGWDADFLIGMPTAARTANINIEFELA